MILSNHVIYKQVLELKQNKIVDAHTLSDRLCQLFWDRLAGIIEKVIDEVDQPGQLIRLDKITLELDCKNMEDFESHLLAQFSTQLELAVKDALFDTNNVEIISEENGVFELMMYYLEFGYLPWNASSNFSVAELEFRLTEALDASVEMVLQFVTNLLEDFKKLERFIACFSTNMHWRLADLIRPGIKDKLKEKDLSFITEDLGNALFWETLYSQLSFGIKDSDQLYKSIEKINRKNTIAIKNKEDLTVVEQEKETPKEGIFIQNAGLVLLNPFMESLFNEFEVVKENRMVKPEKAIQYLIYATTGLQTTEEWNLPLLKLICGVPFEEIILLDHKLSNQETAEVDKMLLALISHWKILKNTSIAGLQETFLQREGRITEGTSNWLLRVEQRAVDMLIDHLPWNIGFIKLPWMKRALITEWT